jgi:hypothetical protein
MAENQETVPAEGAESKETKESNRVFTQSEHDQAIARAKAEEVAKFADYEQIKKEHEAMVKAQKEKEESEMTEREKLAKELKAIADEKGALAVENAKMKVQMLKTRILGDSKYMKLPKVYKDAVRGEDEAEIATNADAMLKQFEEDYAHSERATKTFGLPGKGSEIVPASSQPLTPGEEVQLKLTKRLQNATSIGQLQNKEK